MKKVIQSLVLATMVIGGGLMISCGSQTTKSEQTNKIDHGIEYSSAYVCPMHCEGSGSDTPGQCPVCNMDYVQNESFTHSCPMHPEVIGKEGDDCSKCGMDLKPTDSNGHEGHNH